MTAGIVQTIVLARTGMVRPLPDSGWGPMKQALPSPAGIWSRGKLSSRNPPSFVMGISTRRPGFGPDHIPEGPGCA